MRLDKLKNQLDLILLLVDNRDFTIDELCNKIDISRRNLYYLIAVSYTHLTLPTILLV